jgi:ubiquinone/menaquinone biosynthesis C-methylase UbiE
VGQFKVPKWANLEYRNQALLRDLARREVRREAAFLVPHLSPAMRVLDCGCGPGSITLGLAELVTSGEVVGIDIEAGQLEIGREQALKRCLTNVRFEQASVYALPFGSEAFDAVLAHAVLYHLGRPLEALAEMKRVLKPGGVLGIRDADSEGNVYFPHDPLLDQFWRMTERIEIAGGGDARLGRKQRQLLRESGFIDIRASASSDFYGTPDVTARFSHYWGEVFLGQNRERILAEGWATADQLEMMRSAMREWGQHPDAFFARCRCEAVGWKPPRGNQ